MTQGAVRSSIKQKKVLATKRNTESKGFHNDKQVFKPDTKRGSIDNDS